MAKKQTSYVGIFIIILVCILILLGLFLFVTYPMTQESSSTSNADKYSEAMVALTAPGSASASTAEENALKSLSSKK